MKYVISLLQILVVGSGICLANISIKAVTPVHLPSTLVNVIEGQVFNPYRQPVADVYVELQNDVNSTLARIRTTGSGRFSFVGVTSGHFYIKVLTTGTNYLEQTQGVDIVNVISGASDAAYVDFYLQFDPRRTSIGTINNITEAVFVQEVPDAARKLYKSGVKKISGKNSEKGFDEIEQALTIFPDYFDALNTLGCSYVERKEYQKSFPYLIKSIDINQKSFSSFYSLAYAAYQTNQIPEALEAARASTILQPDSLNAQLLYGTALRVNGNYKKALEVLEKAEKLGKDASVAEIHWQKALVYNKLGRNKEAITELETYLKLRPDAPNKKEIQSLIAKLKTDPKSQKFAGF